MKEDIEFLKNYCQFNTDFDCYVIMGIARKKDNVNITNSGEVVFREVIKSVDNIEKKYSKLLTQCKTYVTPEGEHLNFYIYCSASTRDSRKGYFAFRKRLQLYEEEMMLGIPHHNELKRLDSFWLSALMTKQGRAKVGKMFMLDIDTKDRNKIQQISDIMNKCSFILELYKRETKNGWHYLMAPFNVAKFNELIFGAGLKDLCEVKTDGLFFMDRIEGEK